MKIRPIGPVGFLVGFIVMAALVIGGLAWVTVASLRVEAAQREARAQADRSRDERLALWRLDGCVLTPLGLENNRPYAHYTALHALYPVLETDEDRLAVNFSRFPSPLLSAPLQEWMVLHFQIDPETGWESPQVIPAEMADKLKSPFLNLAITNVTPRREQLLSELRAKLPAAEVIRTLSERERASPEGSPFIVPVPFASETAVPKPYGLPADGPPPGLYRDAGSLVNLALAFQQARELRAASQPTGSGRGGAVNPANQRWLMNRPVPQAVDPDPSSTQAQLLNSSPQTPPVPVAPNQLDLVGTKGQQAGNKLNEGNLEKQAGDYSSRQNATSKAMARGVYDPPAWTGNVGGNRATGGLNVGQAGSQPSQVPQALGQPGGGFPAGGLGGAQGGGGGYGGFGVGPPAEPQALGADALNRLQRDEVVLEALKKDDSTRGKATLLYAESLRKVIEDLRLPPPPVPGGGGRGNPYFGRRILPQGQAEEKDSFKPNAPGRENETASGIALARPGAGLEEPPPPAATPKAPPTVLPVAVHVGPMRPHWLTAADGSEILVLVRAATLENKVVYQGVLLDWPAIRAVLGDMITDLFPAAELTPLRSTEVAAPEQAMTALPVRFDAGPMPDLPPAGWTPLRIGLALAWVAALLALVAVGFGGRALVDLSERRIRFVSAVTHELRTPLTSLRLYLDLLNSGLIEDDEKRREYLATLSGESDRLNRLIENVLDFARLEKRSVRAVMQPTNVRALVDEVRQTWADRCTADGRELVAIVTVPEDQTVTTDHRMAAQILGVLVDNARKYSCDAEDGRIWVWAKPGARGRLVLEVEDRGPGVPVRERGTIFKPFRRGRTADTTAGGAGLGLALAVHWADQLGGKLSYRPADGGTGACFRLELPTKS